MTHVPAVPLAAGASHLFVPLLVPMRQGRIGWEGSVVFVTRKVVRQKLMQAAILATIDS
jgi:hypothetical protein